MSDESSEADKDAKAMFLVTTCHHRLLLHAPDAERDLEKMIFIFDTGPAGEIPSTDTLLQIKRPIDGGKTVLLSFLNEERREFVHRLAHKVGWTSALFTDSLAATRH